MRRGFYAKIAWENIRKHYRLYIPRILAEAGLLGCFYILLTLALDGRLSEALGGSYLPVFMAFGAFVIGLLSFILILYVNSFLMKQRKNEFGMYNVLGMEKRHIIRVLFSESLIASLLSVVLGLLFGTLFYKACSLLICRLLHRDIVAGFYYLNAPTLLYPVLIFLALDCLAFLINSITIRRLKPVELLAASRTGEREPRIKWLVLILGVLTLGAGYYIALSVKSPLQAILLFFAAVILVIIGTYCLYITGTTFVLKCLKKNKNYYYNAKHMPAVAGLLFRMKQNAVGLASIAILATGVLVMISTTVSLYSGVKDTMDTNYPRQLYLSAHEENDGEITHVSFDELSRIVTEAAEEAGVGIADIEQTPMLTVSYLLRDDALLTRTEVEGGWDPEELTCVIYITADTYARLQGQIPISAAEPKLDLAADEIAFCRIMSTVRKLGEAPETLRIGGREYRVKEALSYFPVSSPSSTLSDVVGIVVANDAVLEDIYQAQKASYGEFASEYASRIGVRFTDEAAVSAIGTQFDEAVLDKLRAAHPGKLSFNLDTKWDTERDLLDMYGTFLFLGILLGFVCLFSTILIIYYKQISEGYEDRPRFQIMEKVGMEAKAVRKTIGSQLVLQFYLPLITAAVHTAAAFPILLKLLKILMLTNTQLFVVCTLITLAVFALVYAAVYSLTARTYYKIVH
ncbi:MAG: FtsX-like permease family protein [Oscillospiraceae bacterium]|nr:FtsX-like permease family protein [Oscillospiraceae bacterium]